MRERWYAIPRDVMRWIVDHLLWDTSGGAYNGFLGWLWPARKLVLAVAVSAVLTWIEWVEHHPPAIVIVAVLHFVFVSLAIAIFVGVRSLFGRAKKSPRV